MATLVLTAVGGAVGGPIGSALGAALGQYIDRTILFPAPPRTGPRLTDLAIQTSSYGTQIPKVFGTMRVAGSVIWATDLIETQGRQRGGKGQPSVTTYSYAASFAVALSARPILRVGRIWADGNLLRGAAGDWKSQTGFRLHTGGEDQPVHPLIASRAGAAPAHRGIAYAVFEEMQLADYGNRIPSLTFEVVADEGAVAIGRIAGVLGEGAIAGAGPVDAVDGFAASGSSVAGALEGLAAAAQAWFVPVDGGVAMRNRLDAAQGIDADARVEAVRAPIEGVPTVLAVSHYDPARDYQLGTQRATRPGAGWREAAFDLPAAVSAARGRQIAQASLLQREGGRSRRKAVTDLSAMDIAPGDAVVLPGEPGTWRVARATLEGMAVTLDLVAPPVIVPERGGDAGVVLPAPDRVVGATLVEAFELPPLDDMLPQVPQLYVAAAGTGEGWRAAALSVSRDGARWEDVGATAAPAVMGRLGAALARGSTLLTDRTQAVEVEIAHDAMTLASVDAAARDLGSNLALIGDELVQFRVAERVAATRWRLSDLWRGRRGTAASAHAPGARFVLIERTTLRALPQPGWAEGQVLHVAASGIGDGPDGAVAAAVARGVSVAPPAPGDLRAVVRGDGALMLRWARRSRLGWRWQDGVDAPLVEESERYRVTIGGRDRLTAVPMLVVPAGEWTPGTAAVRQLGTLAASLPATIEV